MIRCNICKGPWHPSTGHYISDTMRWCGPCTRSWVKELVGMQKRRWGGEKFYEHAKSPPPAVLSSFTFHVDKFTPVPGKPAWFTGMVLKATGVNLEEAYEKIVGEIPTGHRVWCWSEEGEKR